MAFLRSTIIANRSRLLRIADVLVVAVAVSLPWSTSATSILIVLWLGAFLPTISYAALKAQMTTAAGGLPVLLFLLGMVGMGWADVPWPERWAGAVTFLRFLAIPFLILQFQESNRGKFVPVGFLASCTVLLAASYFVAIWRDAIPHRDYGVPVKNYITQGVEFTICAFGLLYLFASALKKRNMKCAAGAALLATAFLADILFIRSGRTTLVLMPAILLLWAAHQFGGKGALIAAVGGLVIGAILWTSSPFVRNRISAIMTEVQLYQMENASTSAGERLEFWKKSIQFLRTAPVFGHGTGSIRELFTKSMRGTSGASSEPSANPHNQTFAVAIQLGLVGAVVLWAMWLSHLLLFMWPGLLGWLGFLVVVQNIGGSLFNSHLFDFTEGWLYVFGVGVLGGMIVARRRENTPYPTNSDDSAVIVAGREYTDR